MIVMDIRTDRTLFMFVDLAVASGSPTVAKVRSSYTRSVRKIAFEILCHVLSQSRSLDLKTSEIS